MTDNDYAAEYGSDIAQYPEASGYEAGSHVSELPFVGRGFGAAETIKNASDSETPVQDAAAGLGTEIAKLSADIGFFLLDPIGTLVSAGLTIVLDLVQPLDDLLLMVSGDDGEMQRQIDVLKQVESALSVLGDEVERDANANITSWQGDAATSAGNEVGGFNASADALAVTAAEVAQLLDWARMTAEAIYEVIKAIIAELVSWLVTRGIVALATAPVSAGASVAAFLISAVSKAVTIFMKAMKKFTLAQKIFTKIGEVVIEVAKKRVAKKLVLQLLTKIGAALAKTAFGERDNLQDALSTAPSGSTDPLFAPTATSSPFFSVDPAELRTASAAMGGRVPNADAIHTAASDAGSAEMTWGITGLFFEQQYTEACADLVELTGLLAESLESIVTKLNDCADEYEQTDAEAAEMFNPFAEGIRI